MKTKTKRKESIILKENSIRECALNLGYDQDTARSKEQSSFDRFNKREEKRSRNEWALRKKLQHVPTGIDVSWKHILSNEFVYNKSSSEQHVDTQRLIWRGLRELNSNTQGFYIFFKMDGSLGKLIVNSAKASIRNLPHKDGRNRSVWMNTGSARRFIAVQIQKHLYQNAVDVDDELTEPLSSQEKDAGMSQPFERKFTLDSSFVIGKNLHDPYEKGKEFPVFHFALHRRMDSDSGYVQSVGGQIRKHDGVIEEGDTLLTHYEWENLIATGNIDEQLDHSAHSSEYHEDDTDYRSRESWELDDIESLMLQMAYIVKQADNTTHLLEDLMDRDCPIWNPTNDDANTIMRHYEDTLGFVPAEIMMIANNYLDAAQEYLINKKDSSDD